MKRKKNKIFWPSGAGIWTPDLWTNSRPKFGFWGRLDLSSPGFLELLDFINQLVIDFYLFNLSYWGKARKQNNNFANMWKLFGSRQSQGMPLKLTRASLGHWAREKTEGPKVYENFLLTRCVFMILSGTYIWPTLTTIKLPQGLV